MNARASILRPACIAALQLTMAATAFSQRVESREGSIYFIDTGGKTTKLTDSGHDADPVLSASRDKVVYVRSYPSPAAGRDIDVSAIRIYDLTTMEDKLAFQGPVVIDGEKRFAFGKPRFSPEEKKIYFLFDWSATIHGLASLNVATHDVKFVTPALRFDVVTLRDDYRGDLVVQQRRPALGSGLSYTLFYLFTPDGKELGVVGDSEFAAELFLDPTGLK